jgi:flagellin-like hook-associated protein FlgL
MVIKHNIAAENAARYLGKNTGKLSKSLEKLSSGYKINRAGDNAAGLAVSEKMRTQIAGIKQAVSNAQDGISMVQTFEGALEETHQILNRIKTLATQSANGTYSDDTDRAAIELEYEQLVKELDDIADTDFNGLSVLNNDGAAKIIPGEDRFDSSEYKDYTRVSIAGKDVDIYSKNVGYFDIGFAAYKDYADDIALNDGSGSIGERLPGGDKLYNSDEINEALTILTNDLGMEEITVVFDGELDFDAFLEGGVARYFYVRSPEFTGNPDFGNPPVKDTVIYEIGRVHV